MTEVDLSDYKELLFKSKKNSEIEKLLKMLGNNFRHSEFADVYYQVYEELGIELVFSNEHYFKRFIVHNGFQDKIRFLLPFELDLSLLMKDVEKKLGVPEQTGEGTKNLHYWVSYPELGIGLNYRTELEDLNAEIDSISFNHPQSDQTRIAFQNRTEMTIYFQVRSEEYSPDLIGDILRISADRIDEDDNLFEVLITQNPHFSTNSQLNALKKFLIEHKKLLLKSTHQMKLTVKFGIYSHLTNSFNLDIPNDLLALFGDLEINADFDFIT